MQKVGTIQLEACGNWLRTKRTQHAGDWGVSEIVLGTVDNPALLAQRLAAAFNATRHLSLEQIRGGVVAVPAEDIAE